MGVLPYRMWNPHPQPLPPLILSLSKDGEGSHGRHRCKLLSSPPMPATIIALASGAAHRFSKEPRRRLTLLAGLGVKGDAHAGRTVQHLSRMAKDPDQPNLRQIHLIHAELFDELAAQGFEVAPGQMGENITSRGIDLLGLSAGTRLRLGGAAVIEITGLRNPCHQLNSLAPGLMAATLDKDANGELIRKAGVMAVVITGGEIAVGDAITLESVPLVHEPLRAV